MFIKGLGLGQIFQVSSVVRHPIVCRVTEHFFLNGGQRWSMAYPCRSKSEHCLGPGVLHGCGGRAALPGQAGAVCREGNIMKCT